MVVVDVLMMFADVLCCSYYLKAQQLAPKNGKPYNQLAVIAIHAVSVCVYVCVYVCVCLYYACACMCLSVSLFVSV